MRFKIDDVEYPVEVIKKNNNNAYIRIKEGTIYVTVPKYYSSKLILDLLEKNKSSIERMIKNTMKKEEQEKEFWYLGKRYYVIYTPIYELDFINDKIYVKDEKTYVYL